MSDRFRLSPDVRWRALGEEAVLLDLAGGRYLELNATARRIWELIAEGLGRDEVVAALAAEFDVEPERLEAEVDEAIRDLARRGLVEPVASP
jgi:pyrroloquinoline quinone biosynthesis protein D